MYSMPVLDVVKRDGNKCILMKGKSKFKFCFTRYQKKEEEENEGLVISQSFRNGSQSFCISPYLTFKGWSSF